MPYIEQDKRPAIANAVRDLEKVIYQPGELAFAIYLLLKALTDGERFAGCVMWRGAAMAALDEHRRRCLDPHEDEAIQRNGDVI